MGVFDVFLSWITVYPLITVITVTFLLGDETVYFFGFLSGQGIISLYTVILAGLIGNGGCDIFWFSVARFKYLHFIKKIFAPTFSKENIKKARLVEKSDKPLSKKRLYFMLVFSKFFYGTRLITIFYIAKKEKSFKRILIFNTIAVFSWLIFVTPIMWLLGKWALVSFDTVRSTHKIISLGVVLILVIYLLNKFVISKLIKNYLEKNKARY
ncbi:MAG: hypothetical protein Q8N99_01395 [Nanoarchaeota archaeon]|nr:hypothetical protein [Nanoarchaeota archaeon]